MLQGCRKGAKRVLKGCYKDVIRVLQGCYKDVARMVQECCKGVARVLQGWCPYHGLEVAHLVARKGCYRVLQGVATVLQGCYKNVDVLCVCCAIHQGCVLTTVLRFKTL
jgi:hypothetical protein